MRATSRVLLRCRDPIGVAHVAAAQDEYDAYVPVLVAMMLGQESAEHLAEYLLLIETQSMGLTGNPARANGSPKSC